MATGEIFSGRLDRPTLAGLGRLLDALAEAMDEAAIEGKPRHDVLLVTDELVSNALNHREGRDKPHVEIALVRTASGALELEIADDGPEFDPFARPAPDVDASLEDRPIGGLGIFLSKSLADSAVYRREGRTNRTRLRFSPNS
jgi:anti-sigma regulatory factor (Ser/Thr protein kinase)